MKRIFILTLLLTPLLLSSIAFAATEPYVPMVGVPGLANVSNYTTEMYIDALYKLAITVGGILAVIQIIFGGVMYMFDGSITRKEDGKDKIKGALFGLLIILGAVLLLQTINPDLLNLKIFNNAPSIDQIIATRNKVPPVLAGGRVSTSDEAGMKHLQQTCKGPIGKTPNVQDFAGEQLVCYGKASEANATKGGTFDKSLYLPSERVTALAEYNKSCIAKGGNPNTPFFGAPQCNAITSADEQVEPGIPQ